MQIAHEMAKRTLSKRPLTRFRVFLDKRGMARKHLSREPGSQKFVCLQHVRSSVQQTTKLYDLELSCVARIYSLFARARVCAAEQSLPALRFRAAARSFLTSPATDKPGDGCVSQSVPAHRWAK